jgi:hypothetical protein
VLFSLIIAGLSLLFNVIQEFGHKFTLNYLGNGSKVDIMSFVYNPFGKNEVDMG